MLFSVYFKGYWPVGAVAVVEADNKEEAGEKLFAYLPTALQEINSEKDSLEVSPITSEITILLDGNY